MPVAMARPAAEAAEANDLKVEEKAECRPRSPADAAVPRLRAILAACAGMEESAPPMLRARDWTGAGSAAISRVNACRRPEAVFCTV